MANNWKFLPSTTECFQHAESSSRDAQNNTEMQKINLFQQATARFFIRQASCPWPRQANSKLNVPLHPKEDCWRLQNLKQCSGWQSDCSCLGMALEVSWLLLFIHGAWMISHPIIQFGEIVEVMFRLFSHLNYGRSCSLKGTCEHEIKKGGNQGQDPDGIGNRDPVTIPGVQLVNSIQKLLENADLRGK